MLGRVQTLRHIETVRNFLNACVRELLTRGEQHDQTKLDPPEVEAFERATHTLRTVTYGSPEYAQCLADLGPALAHHYACNRHHPEHHARGMRDMTLLDLVELLADWKAATLRHNDGSLVRSITLNQQRFGYSDELKDILLNTAAWLEAQPVYHRAEES